MARVFILVNKRDQSYDCLPAEFQRVFLFPYIRDFRTAHKDIASIKNVMEEMLGDASLEDRIIFNGPSWLIAIAGMIWLSNPDRIKYDIFRYDMHYNKYVEIDAEIDSTEEKEDKEPEELNPNTIIKQDS